MNRHTVARTLTFRTGEEKAAYLDGAARLEAHQTEVRELAERFAHLPPQQRAEAIQRWVRDNVAFRRDPGGREQLADCATILGRRPPRDDCDGKARLAVATGLAAGLEARIRPVFHGADFVHVQAELRWPGSRSYRNADNEGWVPCELILEGVPLGCGLEAALRDAHGRPVTR